MYLKIFYAIATVIYVVTAVILLAVFTFALGYHSPISIPFLISLAVFIFLSIAGFYLQKQGPSTSNIGILWQILFFIPLIALIIYLYQSSGA